MVSLLQNAGFKTIEAEKYFVHEDLEDHFLYSNKFKPANYLLPEIRENISSFKLFADAEELDKGLNQLQTDIDTGNINSVIKSYDNELGDYLFIIATK